MNLKKSYYPTGISVAQAERPRAREIKIINHWDPHILPQRGVGESKRGMQKVTQNKSKRRRGVVHALADFSSVSVRERPIRK